MHTHLCPCVHACMCAVDFDTVSAGTGYKRVALTVTHTVPRHAHFVTCTTLHPKLASPLQPSPLPGAGLSLPPSSGPAPSLSPKKLARVLSSLSSCAPWFSLSISSFSSSDRRSGVLGLVWSGSSEESCDDWNHRNQIQVTETRHAHFRLRKLKQKLTTTWLKQIKAEHTWTGIRVQAIKHTSSGDKGKNQTTHIT